MAHDLGNSYIFCRKPNPTLISTGYFNEDAIRDDIRKSMNIAGQCTVEFAMKDVHTLCDEPDRLGRWVELVHETIND